MTPHIRTVRTGSGATAVQIVWSKRGGKRDLEHVGSARDGRELAALRATAEQAMRRGQGEFDLDLGPGRRPVVAVHAAPQHPDSTRPDPRRCGRSPHAADQGADRAA